MHYWKLNSVRSESIFFPYVCVSFWTAGCLPFDHTGSGALGHSWGSILTLFLTMFLEMPPVPVKVQSKKTLNQLGLKIFWLCTLLPLWCVPLAPLPHDDDSPVSAWSSNVSVILGVRVLVRAAENHFVTIVPIFKLALRAVFGPLGGRWAWFHCKLARLRFCPVQTHLARTVMLATQLTS